jgi:HNH endonuclease
MTEPFRYPGAPLVRRHGPRGYADADGFRPWLRDEFTFRCVYCLQRESWGPVRAAFDLDHFLPVAKHPAAVLDYDNLLYACASCNSAKQQREILDPTSSLLSPSIRVRPDGVLEPLTPAASAIVWQLGLNLPRLVAFRSLWIEVVRLAQEHKPELHRQLLAYPDDLPDLSALRPPGGNTRPEGIVESHFERRKRGELPDTY